jgi:hypothetical protein
MSKLTLEQKPLGLWQILQEQPEMEFLKGNLLICIIVYSYHDNDICEDNNNDIDDDNNCFYINSNSPCHKLKFIFLG